MFQRIVSGKFSSGFDCVGDFYVGSYFPREKFSMGEVSDGETFHTGEFHKKRFNGGEIYGIIQKQNKIKISLFSNESRLRRIFQAE